MFKFVCVRGCKIVGLTYLAVPRGDSRTDATRHEDDCALTCHHRLHHAARRVTGARDQGTRPLRCPPAGDSISSKEFRKPAANPRCASDINVALNFRLKNAERKPAQQRGEKPSQKPGAKHTGISIPTKRRIKVPWAGSATFPPSVPACARPDRQSTRCARSSAQWAYRTRARACSHW